MTWHDAYTVGEPRPRDAKAAGEARLDAWQKRRAAYRHEAAKSVENREMERLAIHQYAEDCTALVRRGLLDFDEQFDNEAITSFWAEGL